MNVNGRLALALKLILDGDFLCSNLEFRTQDRVSELRTECPNLGQGVRTQDRISELRTGCPNLGQGVRTQDRVFELRTGCSNLGQGVQNQNRLSELRTECPNLGQGVRTQDMNYLPGYALAIDTSLIPEKKLIKITTLQGNYRIFTLQRGSHMPFPSRDLQPCWIY